jgi:CBS domain-containing protein
VSEIMRPPRATVRPDDAVDAAMKALVEADADAAPVVDDSGNVVGMLSNSDLIVREGRLHYPTVLSILGASIELGHKRFERELTDALSATVADVMTSPAVQCNATDSIEDVATLMHDNDIGQIPVIDGERLVGMVARNDVLRAFLSE